jgi:hypothetical protein
MINAVSGLTNEAAVGNARIRASSLLLFLFLVGCSQTQYRFERIDGAQPVELPLKLETFSGVRDGSSVKAEAHFMNGDDRVTMNIDLYLRPPAEFRSGTFQSTIGAKTNSGSVECPSLIFQGGQTALPAVGGTFVMKDDLGRPLYRVTIPGTQLTRQR